MTKFEQNVNVAIITSLFNPYIGGAEKQLEQLAAGLSARNLSCYVVTRRVGNTKPWECLSGVPVHRVFATPLNSGALSTLTFLVSACLFFFTHPKITLKINVLHADCESPGWIAVIIGKLFRKKIVIRMRGTRQIEEIKSSFLTLASFKVISKASDSIITQFDQSSSLCSLGVDASKLQVIPNGVDSEHFKKIDSETKNSFREKNGFSHSIVGLYVGRLDQVKGIDVLLKILPDVIKEFPQFKLVLVGSGPYEKELKTLTNNLQLNENVVFVGPTQDVKNYYGSADAFFLPSKSEGISNALLEAMSMGLPVVVSAIGGSVEIIDDTNNGLLVNPFDASSVLNGILHLLRDSSFREKLGESARKTIERSFSIDNAVTRYISLCSKIQSKGNFND